MVDLMMAKQKRSGKSRVFPAKDSSGNWKRNVGGRETNPKTLALEKKGKNERNNTNEEFNEIY